MMNTTNRYGYLGNFMKSGASKAQDVSNRVTVKSHSRGSPRLSPTYSGGPDGKPNPAMLGGSAQPKGGAPPKETTPGAATEASRKLSGTSRSTGKHGSIEHESTK